MEIVCSDMNIVNHFARLRAQESHKTKLKIKRLYN